MTTTSSDLSRRDRVAMPDVPGVSHRYVTIGDLTLHVAEAGAGPPLLLVHGWPQHWFCWRRLVPLLAADFRLIIPDLRGFGWSDAPARGYAKAQLADDLVDLLDVLDIEQVGLIGHDWGGWLGFLMALDRPERLRGLLALGILHPFQGPTPAKLLQSWRGSYQLLLAAPLLPELVMRSSPQFVAGIIRAGSVRDEALGSQVARLYGEVLRDPARARASVQLYRTFVAHEVRQLGRYRQRRLHVPTHLMVGSNDFLTTRALLDGWQGHADDMLVETIPGAGHFLPEEAPAHIALAARKLFATA